MVLICEEGTKSTSGLWSFWLLKQTLYFSYAYRMESTPSINFLVSPLVLPNYLREIKATSLTSRLIYT